MWRKNEHRASFHLRLRLTKIVWSKSRAKWGASWVALVDMREATRINRSRVFNFRQVLVG